MLDVPSSQRADSGASSNYPSPLSSFEEAIARWEGLYQDNPNDRGNYAHGHDGSVRLVGTMRGVTPDAYATFKCVDTVTVTPDIMRAITLGTAAQIAVSLYFVAPRLHLLQWSPALAIIADVCWGSGARRAISMLQQLIGVSQDGEVGPVTEHTLDAYLNEHPIDAACNALLSLRESFYINISRPGTKNAVFRNGWLNRARWFSTANSEWWRPWATWAPLQLTSTNRPIALPVSQA